MAFGLLLLGIGVQSLGASPEVPTLITAIVFLVGGLSVQRKQLCKWNIASIFAVLFGLFLLNNALTVYVGNQHWQYGILFVLLMVLSMATQRKLYGVLAPLALALAVSPMILAPYLAMIIGPAIFTLIEGSSVSLLLGSLLFFALAIVSKEVAMRKPDGPCEGGRAFARTSRVIALLGLFGIAQQGDVIGMAPGTVSAEQQDVLLNGLLPVLDGGAVFIPVKFGVFLLVLALLVIALKAKRNGCRSSFVVVSVFALLLFFTQWMAITSEMGFVPMIGGGLIAVILATLLGRCDEACATSCSMPMPAAKPSVRPSAPVMPVSKPVQKMVARPVAKTVSRPVAKVAAKPVAKAPMKKVAPKKAPAPTPKKAVKKVVKKTKK